MQGTETREEWNDMKRGETLLRVDGVKGRFVFKSIRLDGETPLWVEVVRAKEQKRMGTRMFTIDRVHVVGTV